MADVVDAANERLADRHMAVGPSHFLRHDLDESWVSLTWEHSIMPYIAEQFFGEEERVDDFALDVLRRHEPEGGGPGEEPDATPHPE